MRLWGEGNEAGGGWGEGNEVGGRGYILLCV